MSKKNPRFGYFLVVPRNPRDKEISEMMQARLQSDRSYGTCQITRTEGTNAFVVKASEERVRAVAGNGRRAMVVSDREIGRIETLKKNRPELELLMITLTCGELSDEHVVEFAAEQRRKYGTGLIRIPDRNRPLRGSDV